MRNALKGWVTTIIGLALIVLSILDFYDVIKVPAPEGISKYEKICYAFIVGFILFLVPETDIETGLKKLVSKKTDQ